MAPWEYLLFSKENYGLQMTNFGLKSDQIEIFWSKVQKHFRGMKFYHDYLPNLYFHCQGQYLRFCATKSLFSMKIIFFPEIIWHRPHLPNWHRFWCMSLEPNVTGFHPWHFKHFSQRQLTTATAEFLSPDIWKFQNFKITCTQNRIQIIEWFQRILAVPIL